MMRLKAVALAFLALCAMSLGMTAQAFASPVTQQDINNNLCSGANLDFSGASSGNCGGIQASNSITSLVHSLINLLSLVVGLVAVIMIIVGGLRYITSGGNDTSVTGAKNTILYAIVGLVVVALAQIIVHFVLSKVTTTS